MVTEPLLELLRRLRTLDYQFAAVTPATHARVLARTISARPTLYDILGWNRPFGSDELEPELLSLLRHANALEHVGNMLRSKVRVAALDGDLFLHSSFPTDQNDSVFFGPDTYRFVRFVQHQLVRLSSPSWIIDMGAGSGAGGIVAGRFAQARKVTLIDINERALELARINAACAGVMLETVAGQTLPVGADLVLANPPYMMDEARRAYRDGGALLGGAVAFDWAQQALDTMTPGGTMLLYTGVAYQQGRAPLIEALRKACAEAEAALLIEELDPDIFGEELDEPAYRCVDRIAAIGAVITKCDRL